MKKLTAILFLAILCLNFLLVHIVRFREELSVQRLDQKIDNNKVNEEKYILLSVPLNLPYFTDVAEARHYGEIVIDDKAYQYVKREIKNNTLYVWCLPNPEKDLLKSVSTALATQASEHSNDADSPFSLLSKIFQKEFLEFGVGDEYERSFHAITNMQNSRYNHLKSQYFPPGQLRPPSMA